MLTDKKYNEDKQYFQSEFKNVAKESIGWLENIANEYRCKIEKKEWKSKYNNYVIYDYEPFCADGFEVNLTLSSRQIEYHQLLLLGIVLYAKVLLPNLPRALNDEPPK